MARRKRHGKKGRIAALSAALLISLAAGIGVKAAPLITGRTALGRELFSDDPDWYTGERGFSIFRIKGDEPEPPANVIKEALPADTDADEQDADPGCKPYPDEWNVSESHTVYKSSFGRYSGTKYFSLDGGGQVKNETELSNGVLIDESRLEPDIDLSEEEGPKVLIMHTHTTESFEPYVRDNFDPSFNYRTTDMRYNTAAVGEAICGQLEKAGIGYIHNTDIHDYPSYNGSYERSAETVKKILADNPSIKVVLDIHRDAIGTNESIMQPVVEVNGKKSAQIMIISGCDDGTMNMPDYLKNFRFAAMLQQQLAEDYGALPRPILFDYRKYNQDLTHGSLLIEVGTHGNTIEQVKFAGELLGKSLVKTLKKLGA